VVPTKTYQERVVVSVSKRGITAVDITRSTTRKEKSKGQSKAAKVGQKG
jgi:hypothetical protein